MGAPHLDRTACIFHGKSALFSQPIWSLANKRLRKMLNISLSSRQCQNKKEKGDGFLLKLPVFLRLQLLFQWVEVLLKSQVLPVQKQMGLFQRLQRIPLQVFHVSLW